MVCGSLSRPWWPKRRIRHRLKSPGPPCPSAPLERPRGFTEDHLQRRSNWHSAAALEGRPFDFDIDLLLRDLYGADAARLVTRWFGREAAVQFGFVANGSREVQASDDSTPGHGSRSSIDLPNLMDTPEAIPRPLRSDRALAQIK